MFTSSVVSLSNVKHQEKSCPSHQETPEYQSIVACQWPECDCRVLCSPDKGEKVQ